MASQGATCSARASRNAPSLAPGTTPHYAPGMAKLTFLGTGLIGAGLTEAAARRGDQVTAWNRTRAKAEALAAHGVHVAGTPAEAIAGAEAVHLMLTDDAAVDSVLEACGPGLRNLLIVDHTTASPKGTAARAERFAKQGIAFLHAPVFMTPAMTRQASGLMLAAGPKKVFERAAAGLRKMAGSIEYLGERSDLAAAYKLFGNAMILTITAGLADVFAMAKSLGIAPADAFSIFGKFNPAATLSYRGLNMSKGDYRASFELSMARKDARLMLESAGSEKLAVLPGIAARMDELLARGFSADDLAVLAVDAVPKASQ